MNWQSTANGWLDRRSTVLTCIAVGLAVLAAAMTFAYLSWGVDGAWVNLLAGVLVLAAPLATRALLTRLRLLITALTWFCLGLLGSYVFGTIVCFAGILLGAALLIDVTITRRSVRTPQTSPATVEGGRQTVDSE